MAQIANGSAFPIGRPWRWPWSWRMFVRSLAVSVTITLLGFAVLQLWAVWQGALARGEAGYDAGFYADLGRRFLTTGEAYFPVQFSGPYLGHGAVNLYPPIALYLFVPFTVIPPVFWWAVPLTVIGWHLWDTRPSWWCWPILALIACTLSAASSLVYGNTIMWSTAAVCIAFRYPVAGALLALKPSDLVVAVLFVRRPAFWLGLGLVVVLSLPFGSLWFEWVAALGNLTGTSVLRNAHGIPALLVPVAAWVARRDRQLASMSAHRDFI